MATQEKNLIKGLVTGAGWIFLIWGIVVSLKGFYDVFWGEPEANFFSLNKWEFITREQWYRYAGFEVMYGMACIGIAYMLWRYTRYVPEYIVRKAKESDDLF